MTSLKKASLKEQSLSWLQNDVFPLWAHAGVHPDGGFYENISFDGKPLPGPRRAMVQCRQIYSVLCGARLETLAKETGEEIALSASRFLIKNYQQPDGSYALNLLSLNPRSVDPSPELYTQAFALFGMAQAYSIHQDQEFKASALQLLDYLNRERKNPHGGWTEIKSGEISYASNPHMHLFEAALAWVAVDDDSVWENLALEISELALSRFIDPEKGILGEYFTPGWKPLLQENGLYIYEPGHQYEWSWLFKLADELLGTDTFEVRHKLFTLAEKHGIHPTRKIVFDELWSDFSPKKQSSRFWPHCERIKAAARLGSEIPQNESYIQAADQAMTKLGEYFNTPKKGMWYDSLDEKDQFSGDFSKSSSLYHIINAIEEYTLYRP